MSFSSIRSLTLARLEEDVPALTSAVGTTMIEACMVCFEDQRHRSGVKLKVEGSYTEVFTINWIGGVTERMLRYWQDEEFTTEQAAYGIAILLIQELTGYTAVQRARKGPGFDFWLGYYEPEASSPMERRALLEVSGIRKGTDKRVKARVAEKIQQIEPSDKEYPAYIVVVEFSEPLARVIRK